MHEMELVCSTDDSLTSMFLPTQILSYLIYPDDESKRKGYIASWGGKGRDMIVSATQERVNNDLRKMNGTTPDAISDSEWVEQRKTLANQITEEWHDPFGGTGTVTQLPNERTLNKLIQKNGWDWVIVGILFRLIIDFYYHYQKPISLADVIPIYAKHPSFNGLRSFDYFEDSAIYRLWQKYKRIVHVCAALSRALAPYYKACMYWKQNQITMWSEEHRYAAYAILFCNNGSQSAFEILFNNGVKYIGKLGSLKEFLKISAAYQHFGMNYRSKNRGDTLIPANAWLIPDIFPPPLTLPVSTPPPSYRKIFTTYRR